MLVAVAWEVALYKSENVPKQPEQEREGALKSVADVQVVLSLLGMPTGEEQGMALSVWRILGIQLSNWKFPEEQLKLEEVEMNLSSCRDAGSEISMVFELA
jgi:hypothetical protein